MISQSQRFLLEVLKASLFDLDIHLDSNINWSDLIAEAKAQTVMGLISPVIPVHDETSEQNKAMYMRILYEQDRLLKCFDVAEIPCVILKGGAASIYYPKPYLRTMGDIDVLVPRKRFVDSLKVLELNGYIYEHGIDQADIIPEDTREVTFSKNGIFIEIHRSFSSPGVEVDDILEPAINKREYYNLNGYRFPILPKPENGLVLLGHINQHLQNNVLGLRQIVDWTMFVHSISDKAFWEMQFVPLVEKTGLLDLVAYITRLCVKYLGLTDGPYFGIDVDDFLVDELLEVVMTDGNFGRRVYADLSADEMKILSASYGIKRYGFFGYFTRVGLGKSRFYEKHPSLKILPFVNGLLVQMFRGGRSLFKKNDVGMKLSERKRLYVIHAKRCELYKKLGVRTGKK